MAGRKGTHKKEKGRGKVSLKGRTVLIVDDMKDNRLLLETVLKAKGYTVHLSANGEEALDVLRSHGVDLIISDILMPVMDGFQLCRTCKSDKTLQGIPFVFYSATYTSEKDREFALSLGAERFVLKPAKPKVFLVAIEEVLAEHRDGTLVAGEGPTKEDDELLVLYNKRLINKLEDKMFELEDRNKLLESVFDHTHILVAYLDREFAFVRVNRAFAVADGREQSYYPGKNLIDVLSDGGYEDVFRQVVRTGEPYFESSRPLRFSGHKKGTTRYWDISLIPIRNTEGVVSHVLLTQVDATERKLAGEELRVSEERYRYLYESDHELHLCIDLKGTLMDVSQAGVDLLGYTKEEVVGKSFREFVPVKYVPIILKNLAMDAVGRTSPVMEIEIRTKDGRLIPLEFAPGSVPLYEEGKLFGVMVSARDVSYRREAERALRESQERYELCTRAGKVGVWDWDIKGNTFYLDPVIKGFLGYTDEEIPNDLETWVTYVHPDDSGPVMKAVQDCLDGRTPDYVYEHRMLHKDGSVRWVRVDGTAIRDGDGKPVRMLGTDTDITERKLAEEELEHHRQHLEEMVAERTEELKEMGERFHQLFDSSPDAVFVIGLTPKGQPNRFIEVNEIACERLGYTYEELLALAPNDIHDADVMKDIAPQMITQVMSSGHDLARAVHIAKDGKRIPVEIRARRIQLKGERAIIAIARDITERERAEAALRTTEARYRALFESVPVGIGVGTRDGRAIDGNSAICGLTGYTLEELRRQSIRDVYKDPADRERIMHLLLRDGAVKGEEVELVRKDGSIFTASITIIPFTAEGEDAFLTMMEDVTLRRREEDELRHRLMRFKLDEGGVYLAVESAPTIAMEAFGDLVKAGHPGHVISRTPLGELPIDAEGMAGFAWMAEIEEEWAIPPDTGALAKNLDGLPPRCAVLIDRLDYLVSKNGFKAALSLVQHLRELAYLQRHIIVLSLDPGAVDRRQLYLLEKETRGIERRGGGSLGEDLLKVVRFVHRENVAGTKPSYTQIAGGVGLSRPTVLARMKRLVAAGYVVAHKTGRRKAVELTDQGRRLFER